MWRKGSAAALLTVILNLTLSASVCSLNCALSTPEHQSESTHQRAAHHHDFSHSSRHHTPASVKLGTAPSVVGCCNRQPNSCSLGAGVTPAGTLTSVTAVREQASTNFAALTETLRTRPAAFVLPGDTPGRFQLRI
jgi:hypothetical protein